MIPKNHVVSVKYLYMSEIHHQRPYGPPSPESQSLGRSHQVSWHHTALRASKPAESVAFYKKHFGMHLVYEDIRTDYINPSHNVTVYFLATLKTGVSPPELTNRQAAEAFVMKFSGTFLQLQHFHETPPNQKMNNGNEEPYRGFGHIAFNCNDVYEACKKLERNGVGFKKRPDEGRMKGLAFALDPDGYWIEIVGRGNSSMAEDFNLSQTMIRVKDPKISIPFYRDILGMTVVREMRMSDFSNYFLASLPEGVNPPLPPDHEDSKHFVHSLFDPCLELTHNHGTEDQKEFRYHNGNTAPVGFSHLSFVVDNVKSFAASPYAKEFVRTELKEVRERGADDELAMEKQLFEQETHLIDPDGYTIKLIQRGDSYKLIDR